MRQGVLAIFNVALLIAGCHASLRFATSKRAITVTEARSLPKPAPLFGAHLAVVAAHHNEDLKWLDDFARQCRDCHVYVYTSSKAIASRTFQHGTIREVPNVGREWGKYLHFIIDEWQSLRRSDAAVLFLHAHAQPNGVDDEDRDDLRHLLPRWPAEAADRILFVHGSETAISLGVPSPVDYGASVLRMWPSLFSELGAAPHADPADNNSSLKLFCINGAEFSVPARRIVHRSLNFYQRLEQWLITRRPPVVAKTPLMDQMGVDFDYAAGSVLELMAYHMFEDKVRDDLYDVIVSRNPRFILAENASLSSDTGKQLRASATSAVRARAQAQQHEM